MFCLFKNSHLYPKVNFYLIAAGWVGVIAWLEFTFIQKDLVFKVLQGEAIMVDLLFGLPLVLMLAVVIYVTIYWFLKLIVVYAFPQAIMPASEYEDAMPEIVEDPELVQELEDEYGDQYWNSKKDSESHQTEPTKKKSHEDILDSKPDGK